MPLFQRHSRSAHTRPMYVWTGRTHEAAAAVRAATPVAAAPAEAAATRPLFPSFQFLRVWFAPTWIRMLAATKRIAESFKRRVPRIVGDVLREHGIAYRLELRQSYEARQYCVQSRETTLAFVSRLLEEEGALLLRTSPDGHTMVLADATGHWSYVEL